MAEPAAAPSPPWKENYGPNITIRPVVGTPKGTPAIKPPWEEAYAPAAPEHPYSAFQQLLSKAAEPITSYIPTQRQMAKEGFEQAAEGVSNLRPQIAGGPEGGTPGALWDTAAGAVKWLTSPVEAGIRTVVGKPIEENTGLPKEYVEFAAALGIPYYGLTKTGVQTTAKKIFTPEAVGPKAEAAAGIIRAEAGKAARDTATTAQAIEQFHPIVNALPDVERLNLIHYMEGNRATIPAQLQPIADTLRTAFEQRMHKIAAMPSHAQMQFVDDYFPHFWKDPNAAQAAVQSGGVSRQGSGASLKARSIPTIEDGIRAGLEPLTTNPLEATMRYVNSMDRFIAAQTVLNDAKALGHVHYIQPKVVGASGNPAGFKVPPGMVPLEGRGATNAVGAKAYADENFARIYNNFITRGWHDLGPEYGSAYEGARKTSNAVTALELAFSGYHALTMAQEAMVNEVARAIQQGGRRGGSPGRAMATAAQAPFAPITLPVKGHQVEKVALGVTQGSPEMREIVDILTEGGARFKGREHALDLGSSAAGSFFTAWKRGSLKTELLGTLQNAQGAPIKGTAAGVANIVGRTMDTVMHPLFQSYIPKLKNGAAYENMKDWIQANPNATHPEKVAAARKIVDSIDNRFGEMIQDNIFWNQLLKQSAMVGMRSYSWNLGTVREIGGGITDTLAGAGKHGMTQRQAYNIALPITYGLIGATYQYLKTGQGPQDVQDYMAPRTGGVDVVTGQPERIIPPGYMKDVFGWTEHPRQEAYNKMATAPRLALEAIAGGKDWRGDPIAPPGDPEQSMPANVPSWLKAYFTHVIESLGPISFKNAAKVQQGSNLSGIERILGVSPAGRSKTDPDSLSAIQRVMEERRWRTKLRHDLQEKNRYLGPDD